ncbi:MAG: DUF6538 domain-containing protein [Brevundimonas sp.]
MAKAPHVIRRGGSYSFRIRVPERFRSLVNRKELWRSLRTRDAREARQRASVAVLLTEELWSLLERLMSSSRPLPSAAQLNALIDQWLIAELDRDAVLRRRTEADREGAWFAGVILERTPEGHPERVVETLDHAQMEAIENGERPPVESPQYLLTDVNEVHLERGQRHKIFEDSLQRFKRGDTSIAARHASELFAQHGLKVDPASDEFDMAARLMARAHRHFVEATAKRDTALWRPNLDVDPAADMVSRLINSRPDPVAQASPNPSPPKATSSRRAGMKFSEAAREALVAISRAESFRPKRRDDYQNAFDTFIDWLGRDPSLEEITPEIAGDFQVALGEHPTHARKRPAYRDLATFAARAAKAAEIGEAETLGPITINGKYLTPLRRVCGWQKKAGSGLANPFDGIAAQKPRKTDPKEQRRDFTGGELQRLFDRPVFTGAKALDGSNSARPGELRIRDFRFWVPLMCAFTGMRLNEACGLAMADVKNEDGITYFHIRDDFEDQSIKGSASRRKVPLHRQLIDLGLLDQIEHWRREGRSRLFPELKVDSKGYYSHRPSKLFNGWIRLIADDDPDDPGKLVFHSTRHTVISRLRSAEVRQDVSYEIVGHEKGDVHAGYGKVDVPTLKAAVDKIAYPGLNLSRLSLD